MATTHLRQVAVTSRVRPARSLWRDAWWQFTRHRLAMAGLATFALLVLATAVGPLVYGVSLDTIDFSSALAGPSAAHPFGTNDLGQDILARALTGGRVAVAVGVVSMLIAVSLGVLVGALAGYFTRLDGVLMRLTDVFLALPSLPLLLLIIYLFRDALRGVFGPVAGIFILIVFVIGILNWMPVARLVRASFLSLKGRDFVIAARGIGASDARLIVRHLLPNALNPVLVAGTLAVGSGIITESALSFLGLGFPPDEPTWGRMLYDARNYLQIAPFMALVPGALIFLAVISINYVGDGLRDALDPRRG